MRSETSFSEVLHWQFFNIELFVEVDNIVVEGKLQSSVSLLHSSWKVRWSQIVNNVRVVFSMGSPLMIPKKRARRRRLAFWIPVVVHIIQQFRLILYYSNIESTVGY